MNSSAFVLLLFLWLRTIAAKPSLFADHDVYTRPYAIALVLQWNRFSRPTSLLTKYVEQYKQSLQLVSLPTLSLDQICLYTNVVCLLVCLSADVVCPLTLSPRNVMGAPDCA